MEVRNYHDLDAFKKIEKIEKAVELLKSPYAHIVHMSLKEDDYIAMHITPCEVSFYISEGQLDITIGEETETHGQGSLVVSPKNIPHGFSNSGGKPAQVIVIKHLLAK